jgi:hypothetical protein
VYLLHTVINFKKTQIIIIAPLKMIHQSKPLMANQNESDRFRPVARTVKMEKYNHLLKSKSFTAYYDQEELV